MERFKSWIYKPLGLNISINIHTLTTNIQCDLNVTLKAALILQIQYLTVSVTPVTTHMAT
jgi:hypothetical protein